MAKILRPCTPLDDEAKPWERFREETPKAFDAFSHFRDLPRTDRTVRGAYRTSQSQAGVTVAIEAAPATWYEWCTRWKWRERVLALDSANDRRDQDSEADERIKSRRLRRAVLVSALRKAGSDLPSVDFSKASAADLARFLEVVVKQLREEYDDSPAQKVALGGLRTDEGAEIPIVISYAQSKT